MAWKSCCCQKNCQYPFYQFDPFSHRNMFWAGLISTKIVHGFEALYRPSPTRKRWLTKTIFFEARDDNGDALICRKHFAVTFDRLNGRITLNIIENTNIVLDLYPSLPAAPYTPTTITQPNSMGFVVFNEPSFSRDGFVFNVSETHADFDFRQSGIHQYWTIDLSDPYEDGQILADFQALNKNLAFSASDYGLTGVGLDGIPIGTPPNENRYIITANYNDCPVNGAILFPPLMALGLFHGGLDEATNWPPATIIKAFSGYEPVPFPFSVDNYQQGPLTLSTFTWDGPLESYGGQTPQKFYPFIQSIWMKFQLDMSCGDFCAQKITFQGPPPGPPPTLGNPAPECGVAEKIPWVKPAGWPNDFKLQPFRRSSSAAPVYANVFIGNPTHTFELKPACYFPDYADDPYHIFCEHFMIAADPKQIVDLTGIPCDCVTTNPLP